MVECSVFGKATARQVELSVGRGNIFYLRETKNVFGAISAGAAGVLTGGLSKLIAATSKSGETFLLGRDLLVNRLGFGAMRLTGEGIWGLPSPRVNR